MSELLPHPGVGGSFPSPVRAGSGWPHDPATPRTPRASTADDVTRRAPSSASLAVLDARVSVCGACPRLVAWREEVATTRRRAYAHEPYWGRPAPGLGDPGARVLVLGLAPAAHGANRTGRVFTGDRSGDWIFAALHRAGLANQPTSTHAGDGLILTGVRIVAAVRCAPPANAPTTTERDTCAPWVDREVDLLPRLRVVVALGAFAWEAGLALARRRGWDVPRPRPRFGHGAQVVLGSPNGAVTMLGCFHVSQQNTFTGRLTEPMLDAVLERAGALALDA